MERAAQYAPHSGGMMSSVSKVKNLLEMVAEDTIFCHNNMETRTEVAKNISDRFLQFGFDPTVQTVSHENQLIAYGHYVEYYSDSDERGYARTFILSIGTNTVVNVI